MRSDGEEPATAGDAEYASEDVIPIDCGGVRLGSARRPPSTAASMQSSQLPFACAPLLVGVTFGPPLSRPEDERELPPRPSRKSSSAEATECAAVPDCSFTGVTLFPPADAEMSSFDGVTSEESAARSSPGIQSGLETSRSSWIESPWFPVLLDPGGVLATSAARTVDEADAVEAGTGAASAPTESNFTLSSCSCRLGESSTPELSEARLLSQSGSTSAGAGADDALSSVSSKVDVTPRQKSSTSRSRQGDDDVNMLTR